MNTYNSRHHWGPTMIGVFMVFMALLALYAVLLYNEYENPSEITLYTTLFIFGLVGVYLILKGIRSILSRVSGEMGLMAAFVISIILVVARDYFL